MPVVLNFGSVRSEYCVGSVYLCRPCIVILLLRWGETLSLWNWASDGILWTLHTAVERRHKHCTSRPSTSPLRDRQEGWTQEVSD
jgi:hypothetical protein